MKPRPIRAIRFFLDREGGLRDPALFYRAIDSKFRSCDLAKIKIGDFLTGLWTLHEVLRQERWTISGEAEIPIDMPGGFERTLTRCATAMRVGPMIIGKPWASDDGG